MAEKDFCTKHSGCVTQIETNKDNIEKIYELIDKIRNRPPVYISFLFGLLMGAIGWLLRYGVK